MPSRRPDDLSGDMAAILDWWREAGVDCAFEDGPRAWLAPPALPDEAPAPADPALFPAIKPRPAVAVVTPSPAIGGDRARWPAALADFAAWWMTEPMLDNGQVRGRVPPRGPEAARLMVLVCEPETDDTEILLAGPQGRLLNAMTAAMGLRGTEVYVASALPRHTPVADWRGLAAQGLGDVLRLHVALARPERLIVFGRHLPGLLTGEGLGSPLPGHAPPQIGAILPLPTQEQGGVPLLAARDLGSLLDRPVAKGLLWQHWLEWTAG